MHRVRVIDSHTGGEPTRVVVAGGPDLGDGPLFARRERFRTEFDGFRAGVVTEPRGSDVLVGALLVPPHEPDCVTGVVFFNNVGVLGMCGHAAIGLTVTLAHLGKLGAGRHRLDTPAGVVEVEYAGGAAVSLENVPSYRKAANLRIGEAVGDVAWGGNWFFLTPSPLPITPATVGELTAYTLRLRRELERAGFSEVDHVELTGPPLDPANSGRNFVLCPGGAYDRSPCGTGTSAKVACLAADGKLKPGEVWRQESVTGSVFEATYRRDGERVIPTIRGTAYLTAEAELLFDPADPLREKVRP